MEMFRNCGWAAFGVLGVGMLATLLGVVALALAINKPRGGILLGIVALAMSLGAPGVGVLGMIQGQHVTDAAVSGASIDPAFKEKIRLQGYEEAGQCLPVGASMGVLPLIVAGIAIAVGAMRKKQMPA